MATGWIGLAVFAAALAILARIALTDFWILRIPNRDVLVLTALALVLLVPGVTPEGWSRIGPAALLFGLGVVFWVFRMMGAGDAKLFFPVGLLVGWQGVALFALALLPVSLLFLGLAHLAARGAMGQSGVAMRLAYIGRARGIPYGVPMALCCAGAMIWQVFG